MPYLQRTGQNITGKEQRRDRRVPLRLEISWGGICRGRVAITSDLSVNGCYIETLVAVDVGDRFLFEMQLPSGHSLELLGEVLYRHRTIGFGIRFVQVTALQRSSLTMLVEHASRAQSAISRPRLVASARG